MATEIELKLNLLDDVGRQLYDLPIVNAFCPQEPVIYDIKTTYYDTPEYHLAEQGLALRVRETDEGLLQTVKTRGKSNHGLHVREEYSASLSQDMVDLSLIEDVKLREQLGDIAKQHDLKPLFVTQFSRAMWMLDLGDGKTIVEMVLDQGEVVADGQVLPINEVELELHSGDAVFALYQIAGNIAEHLAVAIDEHSKAWKGYQLHQAIIAGKTYHLPELKRADPLFFYEQAALLREQTTNQK